MREGKPVTVDVINDTDVPNWCIGMACFSRPMSTEPKRKARPGPAARPPPLSAYAAPGRHPLVPLARHGEGDLHRGSYTGQFGFVSSIRAMTPAYDQEIFLALRDWEHFFTSNMDDDDDDGGPQPEKPAQAGHRSEWA